MKIREIPFILAVAAPVSIVVVWLAVGLPALGQMAIELSAFCHSLFDICAEYRGVAFLGAAFFGASVVVGTLGYGVCLNLSRFFKAEAAIKAMPKVDTGSSVVLIKDDSRLAAFTWGLITPRIYMSTGLLAALTRDELTAVCLHEAHHRAGFDPLRFFLLNTLSDAFAYIPLVRQFAAYMRAKKEFAADDYAVRRPGDAVSLASALLKVSACGMAAMPVPASFVGYDGASERITRLFNLNGRNVRQPDMRVSLRSVVASLMMTVFLAVVLAGPLLASPAPAGSCTTKHCSLHTHTNDMGRSCKTHCKTDKAGHHAH